MSISSSVFFFFQAEDGIRDLVRSRGLGDVYKRQGQGGAAVVAQRPQSGVEGVGRGSNLVARRCGQRAVSYTHLTLPTSDLV